MRKNKSPYGLLQVAGSAIQFRQAMAMADKLVERNVPKTVISQQVRRNDNYRIAIDSPPFQTLPLGILASKTGDRWPKNIFTKHATRKDAGKFAASLHGQGLVRSRRV